MSIKYYGNYEAFASRIQRLTNWSFSEEKLRSMFIRASIAEYTELFHYYIGYTKVATFPLGFLLQVLTVVFLARGSSGYSRSARNWFLLVVGADIASTLYRLYELVTQDFLSASPGSRERPGWEFTLAMWGLRQRDHEKLQDVMCRLFFIILYFPINLSPIALTISSMIRCYCVKFPLQAKVSFTKRSDRLLMILAAVLAMSTSVVLNALLIEGWSNPLSSRTTVLGSSVLYGKCATPDFSAFNTKRDLQFIGYVFMLAFVFVICGLTLLSSVLIIYVLFDSRRSRLSMGSGSTDIDCRAEIRATSMLLGMNVILLLSYLLSRVLILISTDVYSSNNYLLYVWTQQMGDFLFTFPYYTNSVFIVGFSRQFYEFYLPCLRKRKLALMSTSSGSQKTL